MCPPGKDNICRKRFKGKYGNLPVGYDHKYVYSEIGYNLKMTSMQAILGLSQLQRINEFIEKRKYNNAFLYSNFYYHTKINTIQEEFGASASWFGFPVLLKPKYNRVGVVERLHNLGIQTRYLFAGNIIDQPCFFNKHVKYRISGTLINTNVVKNSLFWIGCWPGLRRKHIAYEVECLYNVLKELP